MQVTSITFKRVAIFFSLVALALALWFFSTIVVYIVISLFLSILGRPIHRFLCKIKIFGWSPNEGMAASFTLLFLLFSIGGFIYLTTPILIGQLANIPSSHELDSMDILKLPFQGLEDEINSKIPGAKISFMDIIWGEIEEIFSIELIKNTVGFLTKTVADILVGIFCVSFITFFFLKDESMFNRWIICFVPEKYEADVKGALESIYKLQIRYLVGITIESFSKFLILWLFFWIFGLRWDTALVASLLCGLLNVIPYVGPIIGGAIAMLLGFVAAPEGVSIYNLEICMLIALLVFQIIDNILLQPCIYASSVKAHPLEIFIVILMAGYIGGIVGMLVAIPAYTIVRVLAKAFLGKFKIVRDLTTKL